MCVREGSGKLKNAKKLMSRDNGDEVLQLGLNRLGTKNN